MPAIQLRIHRVAGAGGAFLMITYLLTIICILHIKNRYELCSMYTEVSRCCPLNIIIINVAGWMKWMRVSEERTGSHSSAIYSSLNNNILCTTRVSLLSIRMTSLCNYRN